MCYKIYQKFSFMLNNLAMKTPLASFYPQTNFHFMSIIFFLSFQFSFSSLSGQDDTGIINIKLIGEGKDYYIVKNAAGGYQRNDYEINLLFDITATPRMTTSDGLIIYDIVGIGGDIKILCGIKDDTGMMSYGVNYSKGYYISSDVSLGSISYSIANSGES